MHQQPLTLEQDALRREQIRKYGFACAVPHVPEPGTAPTALEADYRSCPDYPDRYDAWCEDAFDHPAWVATA